MLIWHKLNAGGVFGVGGHEGVHAVEAGDRVSMGTTDDVDVETGDWRGLVAVEGCLVGVDVGLLHGAATEGWGFVGGVRRLVQDSGVL